MRYREFGKHGFKVSEIGFGAWALGGQWGPQSDDDSIAALNRAIDLGTNFVDTAAVYGDGKSERVVGEVLANRPEHVIVATKTPPMSPGDWPPSPYDDPDARFGEAYLRENIEQRLAMLGTDKIDILQLHTWTRKWNRNPKPFEILRKIQREGKIGLVGVSTPEHDQNAVIPLMTGGFVDSVQVIYSLFEQEPAAELLDVAGETGTGIIVRVAFEEGVLTGKYTEATVFPEGDFRRKYFEGDRLARSVRRAEEVRHDLEGSGFTMAQAALKFVLAHPAVSTVIPGIRNISQADANLAVSGMPDLPEELMTKLRRHNWRRAFWHSGK